MVTRFFFNNIKNVNTSHTLFEFNYNYLLQIFIKKLLIYNKNLYWHMN